MTRIEDLPKEWEDRAERWSRGGQHHDGISHGRAITYEACADELREALRWIPVTERRPEAPGWYLVWNAKIMDKPSYDFCGGPTSGWHWSRYSGEAAPTHWRELPEGPKP